MIDEVGFNPSLGRWDLIKVGMNLRKDNVVLVSSCGGIRFLLNPVRLKLVLLVIWLDRPGSSRVSDKTRAGGQPGIGLGMAEKDGTDARGPAAERRRGSVGETTEEERP